MNTFPIRVEANRRRSTPCFGEWIAALTGLTVLGATVCPAQEGFGPSAPRSQSIAPPVPLEFGYPQPTAVLPGTMAPLSIGPAPGFYPPRAFSPYGPPVYFAPPVNVAPWAPIPNPYGVRPPAPFEANFAPTSPPVERERVGTASEPTRSASPANFELSISESFLNRIIARDSVEPGPVRDFVLGAEVTGKQTTVSKLHVDLIPSPSKARIALVLNGDVQTLTTGVTPQAMIDTAGQQQFVAVKDVFFDGLQFSTRHATVFVRARNQTVGATTALTGTVFGGLADRIAYRAAERQKSAGEAVARERTADRLYPRFDGEVDEQLATANRRLEQVIRKQLESAKLMPSSQSVWTTDSRLHHAALVGRESTATHIAPPREPLVGDAGITLSVHESLLNAFVEQSGLKGFKTTDRKLRELKAELLSPRDNRPLDDGESESSSLPRLPLGTDTSIETEIVFDETEPLTFKLETDRLVATVKATFKPAGQAVVPPMIVSIPFHTELKGEKIRWVADSPRVVAQDRADPTAPQTFVEMMIQKIIEADLTPLEFDRALPAAYWPVGGQAPRVTSIKSAEGWVGIAID